jgi:hypothetical protein
MVVLSYLRVDSSLSIFLRVFSSNSVFLRSFSLFSGVPCDSLVICSFICLFIFLSYLRDCFWCYFRDCWILVECNFGTSLFFWTFSYTFFSSVLYNIQGRSRDFGGPELKIKMDPNKKKIIFFTKNIIYLNYKWYK